MSLAQVAGLLADPTRAAFCLALLDGRAWTAGELARHAGVAPSDRQRAPDPTGRRRPADRGAPGPAPLRAAGRAGGRGADRGPVAARARAQRGAAQPAQSAGAAPRHAARTCYDHLAGQLGRGDHRRDARPRLTPGRRRARASPGAGVAWLAGLGITCRARGPPAARARLPGLDRAAAPPGRRGRRGAVPDTRSSRLDRADRHRAGVAGDPGRPPPCATCSPSNWRHRLPDSDRDDA